MSDLIVREFLGNRIRQREDGFLSLTDMCQANGKLFGNWSKTKDAQQYLEALQEKHYSDRNSGPIEVNEGGDHSTGLTGTWGDRRVALRLAQWISADFALQVDEWIEELMLKGTASIAPPKTPLELAKDLKLTAIGCPAENSGLDWLERVSRQATGKSG